MGFKPVTSAILVQCLTNWAVKPHIGSKVILLSSYLPVQWNIVKWCFPSNCLKWKIYCNDHSSLSSTTAVQYAFHIYSIKKQFTSRASCHNNYYWFHKTKGNNVICMKIKSNFPRDILVYQNGCLFFTEECQQHDCYVIQTITNTSSIANKRKNVLSTKQLPPTGFSRGWDAVSWHPLTMSRVSGFFSRIRTGTKLTRSA